MARQDIWHDGRGLGGARRFRAVAHAAAGRIKRLLKESELGALLCFDMNNVRYITATHIGTWAMDKLARFTLLPQDDEPILWDFGSAARHHQLYCPWLGETARVLVSRPRGAMLPGRRSRRRGGTQDSHGAGGARIAR